MDRRRKILLALLCGAPFAVVGAACTFPEVTFSPLYADGGGSSSGTTSSGSSGTSGNSSSGDSSVSDASIEATTRDDGSAVVTDPSVCLTRPKCDCDQDGYLNDTCVADAGDAGLDASSRPGDCDDFDPLRHPDAGYVAEIMDANAPPPIGDWDCNGTVERDPQMVKCKAPTGQDGVAVNCNGGDDGFRVDTACGQTGDVWTCPKSALGLGGHYSDCDPKPMTTGVTATCK